MKKYNVLLWSGAGYELHGVEVEASHEEHALEMAVAKIEEQGLKGLFFDECEDLEQMEEQGLVLYVDAMTEGANAPHWVDAQNLRIEEIN